MNSQEIVKVCMESTRHTWDSMLGTWRAKAGKR